MSRGTEWNRYEDGQPARSRLHTEWTPEDKFTWELEIRDWLDVVSIRRGEIELKGSWDGTLTLRIRGGEDGSFTGAA